MHWKKGPSLINFGPIDINAPALRKVCEFWWILMWPFLGRHPSTCQSFRKALLSNKWLAVSSFHLRNLENVRPSQVHGQAKKQLISASQRRISDAVHCDWRKILATYSGAQVRLFKRPSDSVSHGNCEDWCGNQQNPLNRNKPIEPELAVHGSVPLEPNESSSQLLGHTMQWCNCPCICAQRIHNVRDNAGVYPLIPNTTVVPTNWYCDMHSSSLASYPNTAKKSATYPFFLLPKTSPNNLIKTTPGCSFWEIWDWSICFSIDPLQVKNQGPIWRFYPLNDKN